MNSSKKLTIQLTNQQIKSTFARSLVKKSAFARAGNIEPFSKLLLNGGILTGVSFIGDKLSRPSCGLDEGLTSNSWGDISPTAKTFTIFELGARVVSV